MATVIESKEKPLDIDFISEYEREESVAKPQTKSYAKDLLNSASEVISVARAFKTAVLPVPPDTTGQSSITDNPRDSVRNIKPDVLETLWPGIHQDFSQSVTIKRTPSYYLTLGFMGGAVIALIVAWSFSAFASLFSNYSKVPVVLNQSKTVSSTGASEGTTTTGVRVPLVSTYEVQEGDTLAGIVLRNYKHVSPRLLDEICKANNLTDPNVLNFGQKLILPEYHY